jgi:hypothetical protein
MASSKRAPPDDLDARKAAVLAREATLREVRGVTYPTLAEALAACVAHDKALGLPNAAMQRWTEPIELVDGWLVQSPDRGGPLVERSRVKVSVDVAAEAVAEVRAR